MTLIKFGIASLAEHRKRMLDIAAGKVKIAPDDPKVWFPSAAAALSVFADASSTFHQELRAKYAHILPELATTSGESSPGFQTASSAVPQFRLVRMERDGEVVSDAALADRIVVAFE